MINMDFTFEHFLALKNTLMATLTLLLNAKVIPQFCVLAVLQFQNPQPFLQILKLDAANRCGTQWKTTRTTWTGRPGTAAVLRVFVAEFLHVVL